MLQTLLAPLQPKPAGVPVAPLAYRPSHLTHVEQVYDNGRVDVAVVIYLPAIDGLEGGSLDNYRVQVKAGNRSWIDLTTPNLGSDLGPNYWSGHLQTIAPGTALTFRYRPGSGVWKPLVPMTSLDRVYSTLYVTNHQYTWKNSPPPLRPRASVTGNHPGGSAGGLWSRGLGPPESGRNVPGFHCPTDRQNRYPSATVGMGDRSGDGPPGFLHGRSGLPQL